MARVKSVAKKAYAEQALPIHIRKGVKRVGSRNKGNVGRDEYHLASMFPNDDVMRRVYSIIRANE